MLPAIVITMPTAIVTPSATIVTFVWIRKASTERARQQQPQHGKDQSTRGPSRAAHRGRSIVGCPTYRLRSGIMAHGKYLRTTMTPDQRGKLVDTDIHHAATRIGNVAHGWAAGLPFACPACFDLTGRYLP